jgi:hypothetical protein
MKEMADIVDQSDRDMKSKKSSYVRDDIFEKSKKFIIQSTSKCASVVNLGLTIVNGCIHRSNLHYNEILEFTIDDQRSISIELNRNKN